MKIMRLRSTDMELSRLERGDENAVSIVSDGTEEGTVVYIGGRRVDGLVSVHWELRPTSKKARVVLEIDAATLDAQQSETAEIRRVVQLVGQQRRATG